MNTLDPIVSPQPESPLGTPLPPVPPPPANGPAAAPADGAPAPSVTVVGPVPAAARASRTAAVPARWWPLALVLLALAGPVAVLVDAAREVPFFAFTPGDAEPVGSRLQITKAQIYDAKGEVLFVTVGVPRLTGLSERFARQNHHDDIVPARDLLGDQSPQENHAENLKLMGYSKDFATYVALQRLGYDVQLRGGGAAIDSTCLKSSADGKSCAYTAPAGQQLRHDDVIVAIDGSPVHLPTDIPPIVAGKAAGDTVTLTVRRLGEKSDATITVPLVVSPDDPTRVIIGFIPNGSPPADLGFEFPVGVGIDSGQVSGPSAGLAFTLALLDKLSPGELTGGVKVAATGTMSPSGAVGAIGGLRQKTVAVQRAGAKVFLVPESEKAEAIKQAEGSDLKVVGVATIDDALRALADLGGNAATFLPKNG